MTSAKPSSISCSLLSCIAVKQEMHVNRICLSQESGEGEAKAEGEGKAEGEITV